jgi:predicted phage terminase large subunit-like protein
LLIEKKAAGAPLIQELRQMDMIVEEYSPSRSSAGVSNDKRARVNAVSPLFFDKVVWAPEQRWAMDVINECAEFPNGENDDFVDCCSMALARYRRGGFVSLSSDRGDEPQFFKRKTSGYY